MLAGRSDGLRDMRERSAVARDALAKWRYPRRGKRVKVMFHNGEPLARSGVTAAAGSGDPDDEG